MQRTVTIPAALGAEALDELKDWLGITRPREDALLTDLIGASVSLCEAFTGQAPLEQTIEERIPAIRGTHLLSSRPVRSLASVEWIGADAARIPVLSDHFRFRIDAAQTGSITLENTDGAPSDASAIAIVMRAGIAAEWRDLPEPLRHGMIRLAAFHYRDRDAEGESGRDAAPPASVAALWRPWRTIRLA